MRFTLILFLAAFLSFSRAQYTDVPPQHWAENAVAQLTDLGILTGFPDGSFSGDAGVTRYQLAVTLARFWESYGTDSLEELWSTVIGVQTGLDAALNRQELLINSLDSTITRLERLEELSARFSGAINTLDEVQNLSEEASNQAVFAAQDVKALRGELAATLSDLRISVANLRQDFENAPKADPEQQALMSEGLEIQRDAIAALTQRLDELAGSQDEVLGDATTQMRELRDEVAAALAVREGAWQGSLAFSAGFRGRGATLRLDATLATPRASGRVSLYERALDAGVEGRLNNTFGLTTRFISGPLGETGLVGPVVQVSPALSVAALGGTANGLALGSYVNHDGAGADAFLPGLDAFLGGFLQEDEFGSLSRFNIVGSARYSLPLGGSLILSPRVTYRRVGGVYQVFVPELGLSTPLNGAVLTGAVRVGLVTDLTGGPGRTVPEGEVSVVFPGGLFATAELSGQLPRLYGLGSLNEPNPLDIDHLNVGLRVGYTLDLDALW